MCARTFNGAADHAQHGRVQAVGFSGQFRILAVDRQHVLGKVVGADREEVCVARQYVGLCGGSRHFDHDADRHFRCVELGADACADGAQGDQLRHRGDHREHDRQPRTVLGGAIQRTQLRLQQVGTTQQQARAAHTQERVFFVRQFQMRHLLVATDIQRTHDQRAAIQCLRHCQIGGMLFVFAGGASAFQEQEFGAHQADAFGALGQRHRDLVGQIDVGANVDVVAVGGFGRQCALRGFALANRLLFGDMRACGVQIEF